MEFIATAQGAHTHVHILYVRTYMLFHACSSLFVSINQYLPFPNQTSFYLYFRMHPHSHTHTHTHTHTQPRYSTCSDITAFINVPHHNHILRWTHTHLVSSKLPFSKTVTVVRNTN